MWYWNLFNGLLQLCTGANDGPWNKNLKTGGSVLFFGKILLSKNLGIIFNGCTNCFIKPIWISCENYFFGMTTCFTPTCCTLWADAGFSLCCCRSQRLHVRPTPAKPLSLVLGLGFVQRRRSPTCRRAGSGCRQKYWGSLRHETGQLDSHFI